jgi:hypothetical protein
MDNPNDNCHTATTKKIRLPLIVVVVVAVWRVNHGFHQKSVVVRVVLVVGIRMLQSISNALPG